MADDSRITPLGAKLRHYKIDELPELWDVLIGNMSFVGPRPDAPGYADQLQGDDRKVLKLRPGITGPASIKFRNENELMEKAEDPEKYYIEVIMQEKIKLYLEYLKNASFFYDLKLIFETFWVIVKE